MKKLNPELVDRLTLLAFERAQEGQRKGQALFNSLWEVDEELGREISFTEADCFYDDHLINKFWNRILE